MEYGWATTIIILSLQDKNLFSEILLWLPVTPLNSLYWLSSGHSVTRCLAVRKAVTLEHRNLARRQTIVTVVFMKTTIVIRWLTEAFHHHTKLLLALIPSVLVGHIASKFHYWGVHIPSQGIGELKWLSPKNQYLFPRDFLSFEIYFITIMPKTTRSEGKKEKKYLGCFFSFYWDTFYCLLIATSEEPCGANNVEVAPQCKRHFWDIKPFEIYGDWHRAILRTHNAMNIFALSHKTYSIK